MLTTSRRLLDTSSCFASTPLTSAAWDETKRANASQREAEQVARSVYLNGRHGTVTRERDGEEWKREEGVISSVRLEGGCVVGGTWRSATAVAEVRLAAAAHSSGVGLRPRALVASSRAATSASRRWQWTPRTRSRSAVSRGELPTGRLCELACAARAAAVVRGSDTGAGGALYASKSSAVVGRTRCDIFTLLAWRIGASRRGAAGRSGGEASDEGGLAGDAGGAGGFFGPPTSPALSDVARSSTSVVRAEARGRGGLRLCASLPEGRT